MDKKRQNLLDAIGGSNRGASDGLNIGELIDLLWSGKWVILACMLTGLALGKFYSLVPPPQFTADGLVQIEKQKTLNKELSELLGSSQQDVAAEVQILQSRMLMDAVIEMINLRISVAPRRFPYVGAAISRSWMSSPRKPVLGLSRYAWGGERIDVSTLVLPEDWAGRMMVLETGAQAGTYKLRSAAGELLLTGKVGELSESADRQFRIFVSDLKAWPGTEFLVSRLTRQQAYAKLQQSVTVAEVGQRSGVLKLTAMGPSPSYVTKVVNAYQSAYLRQNVERKSEDASKTIEFIKSQLPQTKERLDQSEAKLTTYLRQADAVDISAQTQSVLAQSVEVETKLFDLQQKRREALQRFTTEHPSVKTIDQQIASYSQRKQSVAGQIDALPSTQQEIFNIRRDLEAETAIYTAMLNSLQTLELAKAGTVGNVRILDSAITPLGPSGPNRRLIIILATVVGLGLGVAWTLLRRLLIVGVDDPAFIESHLGLSTFATIPYVNEQRSLLKQGKEGAGHSVLSAHASTSIAAEAFKSLRSALHFGLADSPNNVIMLTGPQKSIGKTFVSTNLGAVLGQAGKKVLIVDADMRAGILHRVMGLPTEPGLSQYLAHSATLEEVIQVSQIQNVHVICRGKVPPNPAELLLTEHFEAFVKEISSRYDYVLIDTPPILPVTDASIVGRFAGTSLMVLKAAEHPVREIVEAQRRLAGAGIALKGVILNQVGRRAGSYGYGGYGYRYYEYR